MFRHLLKLAWNRKRRNALVLVEITISFIVLFAVVAFATLYAHNYGRPLGFDSSHVWKVTIDTKVSTDDTWTPEMAEQIRQLNLAVRDMPEIEHSAGALVAPYDFGGSYTETKIDGREIPYQQNEVTDDFDDVLDLEIVRGRWFSREDDGASPPPMVVNAYLANELFGSEDPVGRIFGEGDNVPGNRIVGVVSDFRKDGEFSSPAGFAFNRANLNDPKVRPPRQMLIKVKPETGAAFEEKLVDRLQQVARGWSFEVEPITDARDRTLRVWLAPLATGGLVALFLLIMVGLGLTGVLWQNVTRRTREIGIRRVQGATVWDVHCQILGELLVVTTLALVVGAVIVLQIPLIDPFGIVNVSDFATAILVSAGLIYVLTFMCGLYPSVLATRVQPVEALRHD
jgi:putative ABC transport system permease protein